MPANAGIQVTDSVRHTVGKRYPGCGWTPVFTGVTQKDWIPAFAGMTEKRVNVKVITFTP
jgi:hypothetical protein